METKRAALKVSPSVVVLVSHTAYGYELSQGCGTVIAVEGNTCTLVTSLNLIRSSTEEPVALNSIPDHLKVTVYTCDGISCVGEILTYDFHYNILLIKFHCESPMQSAILKFLEFEHDVFPNTSFQLRPHRIKFKRDEPVVVVGRYYRSPFEAMTAVGVISERCPMRHQCTELLVASCAITRCGDGSPLINRSGEVIGIVYYMAATNCAFLPMNIVCKWWNYCKEYKISRHPFYGFKAASVCAADLPTLEKLMRRFPSISGGLVVKKVLQGSCAKTVGLMKNDIITKCNGIHVNNFLELWEILFDKVGVSVELEVIRTNHSTSHKFSMVIGEATPNELNSWPRQPY